MSAVSAQWSGTRFDDVTMLSVLVCDPCANLATAAGEEEGWVNVLTNGCMKICKKAVELSKRKSASEIYLR